MLECFDFIFCESKWVRCDFHELYSVCHYCYFQQLQPLK